MKELPHEIVKALLFHHSFDESKAVLDPYGSLSKVLKTEFEKVELVDNFFSRKMFYDYVISAPPQSNSLEYTVKSIQTAMEKIALFFPLDFLSSVSRFNQIFNHTPPSDILIFSDRVRFWKNDKWESGNSKNHAWYIWDNSKTTVHPEIKWIFSKDFK